MDTQIIFITMIIFFNSFISTLNEDVLLFDIKNLDLKHKCIAVFRKFVCLEAFNHDNDCLKYHCVLNSHVDDPSTREGNYILNLYLEKAIKSEGDSILDSHLDNPGKNKSDYMFNLIVDKANKSKDISKKSQLNEKTIQKLKVNLSTNHKLCNILLKTTNHV